jgi:hypothetical protein
MLLSRLTTYLKLLTVWHWEYTGKCFVAVGISTFERKDVMSPPHQVLEEKCKLGLLGHVFRKWAKDAYSSFVADMWISLGHSSEL